MQLDFLTVLITVLSLIILAVPGYLLAKAKMFNKSAGDVFSVMVLYGCQPMLMFMGFQKTGFRSDIALNMLIVFGLAILIQLIMVGIIYIFVKDKVNDQNQNAKRVLRFASVFSNCGYMGVPFLQMLFSGNDAVLGEILIYSGALMAGFNLLNWSVGIYMITGNKKDINFKQAFLNPTLIGVYVGLVCFLIFKKPIVELAEEGTILYNILSKFIKSVGYLSDMVTPLAMTVTGVKLANVNFKQLFINKLAYLSSIFKLIVMPLVCILVVAFLPVSNVVKYTIFFSLSMPSATSTVMFAIRFKGDGEFGSIVVLLSTILSVIAIPVMFLLFSQGFGIVL